MKISAKSRYGLRAMVYLAKAETICPLKTIARDEKIPADFLEKIISKLQEAGLVKAKRGARGGYSLAHPPQKITVGRILGTLEGTMAPVLCVAKERDKRYACPRKRICPTKIVWQKIQDAVDSTLHSLTLADLAR